MRDSVPTVVSVAARVVIGLMGLWSVSPLKYEVMIRTNSSRVERSSGGTVSAEYRIVRHQVFDVDPWAVIKINFDFYPAQPPREQKADGRGR